MSGVKKDKEIVVFNQQLSERQQKVLKAIVDEYTATAVPVASKNLLLKSDFSNLSSATIRNEMAVLERFELIEKPHTSAGRVPSIKGYNFYNENLTQTPIDKKIKDRLKKILYQREASIDVIFNESVNIINEVTNLPAVISDGYDNELLKRIDLVRTNDLVAIVLLVTSKNRIIHHSINLSPNVRFEDLSTCINVLDERLVDTPLWQIKDKMNSIKDIIRNKVHAFEAFIAEIMERIFDFYSKKPSYSMTHVGVKYIMKHAEFEDQKKLEEMLNLLEDTSVWEQISLTKKIHGSTNITYGDSFGKEGFAIASTQIQLPEGSKQLSIVGPTRMDYAKVKALLDFIKAELEKIAGTKQDGNN
ncbi:heat-inducible transcriptional repressor HrcA [Ureaplasma diversum]|uniref:Heat-inducible transcription repressor HrcA n=1 Tax=Ureaplasma diversum NCTC 246 TaxID=1188241 RepID=A0A084EYF3_9BACT|nr:heat-inducible transcriptional repressor HrcA [Ureaplasma diversum]KEZ22995.1 Heat-inducible transcription repressor HrcA [Ureaplasma diversum NCTC 246]